MTRTLAPPEADRVFGALADATRRDLLTRLGEGSAASASALARDFPITRQAVVRHLEVLESAQLVRRRPAGREVRFEVEPGRLAEAASWLAERAELWGDRLADLRARLEAEGPLSRQGGGAGPGA